MATTPEGDAWQVLGSRSLYESRWVNLSLTEVELPSGKRFEHHTVTMPAAAVAVVLDDEHEHVLMTWRHRFVPDVWNFELPGGLVEDDEDPAETIAREILEETGYRPRDLHKVVGFEPMIGMVSSPHHVFIADGATKEREPVERDEGRFEWVPVGDLRKLISSGKVLNSGTLVGLLLLLALDDRPQGS
jgi:8-oxo-dGTP pyrophosphatase MutT (NUDIX family)